MKAFIKFKDWTLSGWMNEPLPKAGEKLALSGMQDASLNGDWIIDSVEDRDRSLFVFISPSSKTAS